MSKWTTCACGKKIKKGRTYCDTCKLAITATTRRVQTTTETVRDASGHLAVVEETVFQPWAPRPKPPPLMTDAEQRAIDRAVNARMSAGYGNSEVKRLSKREIAAIAGEITPIDQIPANNAEPWTILQPR